MAGETPSQIAAALSEFIYNRNASDQPLKVKDNLGANFVRTLAPTGLTQVDDFYYDYSNGFVGAVADVGGTRYVAYRGPDGARAPFSRKTEEGSSVSSPARRRRGKGVQTDDGRKRLDSLSPPRFRRSGRE